MPRKNKKEFTQMQISWKVIKRLKLLKVHPNQSYDEVIENLLNSAESST